MVTIESVVHANELFWEPMLAMRLSHDEVLSADGLSRLSQVVRVVAACRLDGVWQGRVEVCLSEGLAVAATAAMLMQPVESVASADLLDAAREIANMIAGTIKSALPRPCTMSVPEAWLTEGDGSPGRGLEVGFSHASGELMVRVWSAHDRAMKDSELRDDEPVRKADSAWQALMASPVAVPV